VLPSIVNEVLKATVAQFDADQLLTQREKVSRQIREALNERAAQYHLQLDDVSITHLLFSKEFTTAIESKQVAQQVRRDARVSRWHWRARVALVVVSRWHGGGGGAPTVGGRRGGRHVTLHAVLDTWGVHRPHTPTIVSFPSHIVFPVRVQDAERSKFVVMKAEQEAKAAIIRAEGEGEAAELVRGGAPRRAE
jgi:hypothetical protein